MKTFLNAKRKDASIPVRPFTQLQNGLSKRKCSECHKNRQTLQQRIISDESSSMPPIGHDNLRSYNRIVTPDTYSSKKPIFGFDLNHIKTYNEQRNRSDSRMTTITPTGDETEFATIGAQDPLPSAGKIQTSDLIGTADGEGAVSGKSHCSPSGKFTSIPSGTVTATFGSGKFGAPFKMNAEFDAPIPCTCVCGEYRQYVRGYAKVNGTNVTHALCSNTMSPTVWHEDCLTSGGKNYKYGYHSNPFATSRFTNPDQATGCTFNGDDFPGFPLSSLSTGDKLEISLEFKGKLVDACNSDSELASSTWKVKGKGTVP